MAQCKKIVLDSILSFLPIACIAMFAISINFVVISLNPSVQWSKYEDDLGWGMQANYFHTLWTYLDSGVIEGVVQGLPKYSPVLKNVPQSEWKKLIRQQLYRSIGVLGGGTFFVIFGTIIHGVTKQKLFVVICNLLASGAGITAGYFNICTTKQYRDSLYIDVSKNGKHLYKEDKNIMILGYQLVFNGTILAFTASGLILLYILVYILFSDGKWIWQRTTGVHPDAKIQISEQQTPPRATFINKTKENEIMVQDIDQN